MRSNIITAACLAALAFGSAHAHDGHDQGPAPAGPGSLGATELFRATLLGSNEIGPIGGDTDGFGSALVSIDPASNTIGFEISFANLSTLTAAHIHAGPAGVNGPVVVNFGVPAGVSGAGSFAGSVVDADAALISAITAGNFYVNLHTSEFAGGALRGQLAPIPEPETYALMLAGLGVVGWSARRRRAQR
jgi:hypothetical protein